MTNLRHGLKRASSRQTDAPSCSCAVFRPRVAHSIKSSQCPWIDSPTSCCAGKSLTGNDSGDSLVRTSLPILLYEWNVMRIAFEPELQDRQLARAAAMLAGGALKSPAIRELANPPGQFNSGRTKEPACRLAIREWAEGEFPVQIGQNRPNKPQLWAFISKGCSCI